MSAFPGVIDSAVFSFLAFFTVLPLLGAWLVFIAIVAVRDLYLRRPFRSSFGVLSAVLVFAGAVLLWFQVPRRVAFAVSRPGFEAFVRTGDIPADKTPFQRRFGVYRTEAIARDERGGIYFRTHHGMDGLSPDQMSYGFAYQPNPKGSPFGAAGYTTRQVSHDWHIFSVSDDYY